MANAGAVDAPYMPTITLDIRHKHYRRGNKSSPAIIRDLHLRLHEHEFVCLVGPSGCGKTTLLNLIAGLDADFDGHIDCGCPLPRMGYVFQNPRLLPWRTVRQNLQLVLPHGADPAILDALLAITDLTAYQHAYPEHLSLGMCRRVAIARAFAIDPDLLLMDEPFVSLDAPSARQIRQWLLDVWQRRPHTVLFVTHDLREALSLADRLIFLSRAPMAAVHDIPLSLPRAARQDDTTLETMRQSLLVDYPELQNWL